MMDELERLDVHDKSVLRAHNSRGFTYLSGIIEVVDLSHNEVREAATYMFKRMDPNLVFKDSEISPGCKRMFAELLGLPEPKIERLPYLRGLFKEGVYSLKNSGVTFTVLSIKNYVLKNGKRKGTI